MFNNNEIIETVAMISDCNLDVRTITMGLSLLDCVSGSAEATANKIYEKIVREAGNLVSTGEKIAAMYGIPIVNKRVAVTPISLVGASCGNYIKLAKALDKAAEEIGIDFVGGYSALVQKGATPYEKEMIETIPEALAATKKVCSSVNIASTRAGINMDAVRRMG